MLRMKLPGKTKRGRPKRRFMDAVREDMAVVEVTEEDAEWRWKICCGELDGSSRKMKKDSTFLPMPTLTHPTLQSLCNTNCWARWSTTETGPPARDKQPIHDQFRSFMVNPNLEPCFV